MVPKDGGEKKYCIYHREMHLVTHKTNPEMRCWRCLRKACRKEVLLQHDTFNMVINGRHMGQVWQLQEKVSGIPVSPPPPTASLASYLSSAPLIVNLASYLSSASSQLFSLSSPISVSCSSIHSSSLPLFCLPFLHSVPKPFLPLPAPASKFPVLLSPFLILASSSSVPQLKLAFIFLCDGLFCGSGMFYLILFPNLHSLHPNSVISFSMCFFLTSSIASLLYGY